MAGTQGPSFQKKGLGKRSFIKGTSRSAHNSQLLISSGIPSFDSLLGGGVPVGSLVLINEDEYSAYAKLMIKYFLAEGLVSQHALFFASSDINPEEMVKELPLPVDAEIKAKDESDVSKKKMTIAWRYENLKMPSYGSHKHFGHYFDLSGTINPEIIKNSDITFFSEKEVILCRSVKENAYFALLKSIQGKLKEGLYFASQTNSVRNILRIVLFHINSPLWHSDSEKYLLIFLYSLRALIRNAYATCYITLPHSIYKKNFMNKCIHFADIAVQLQSFAGTSCENLAPYRDYHGFFIIQKIGAINTLVGFSSQISNLAFKLRRKKLVIEAFYLPAKVEDTKREGDNSTVLMCSSRSGKLEF